MKNFILFLNGKYPSGHLSYYKSLLKGKVKVSIDGGYRFFKAVKIVPDVLIGDFDSSKIPRNLPSKVKIYQYPTDKDKTDLELAIDYCLKHKTNSIEIVMPDYGEVDHLIGNVMILRKIGRYKKNAVKTVRILNNDYTVHYLKNNQVKFDRFIDDIVSVVSLSESIKLTCRGTMYDVTDLRLSSSSNQGMRNKIVVSPAVFSIKGEGLVIHLKKRSLKILSIVYKLLVS